VLEAGLTLSGARRDRQTTLSTSRVLVTVSGEASVLDALERGDPAPLLGQVDVSGLGNGRHEAEITIDAPDGVTVNDIAPRTVVVRIAPALATPLPTPGPTPSAGPPASLEPTGAPVPASATAPATSVPPSAQPADGPTDRPTTTSPRPTGGS
jgi:hypothetical protein